MLCAITVLEARFVNITERRPIDLSAIPLPRFRLVSDVRFTTFVPPPPPPARPLLTLALCLSSVEVCVLPEADEEGGDGLLRPVLPRPLLHSVSPHVCSGRRHPHAPR